MASIPVVAIASGAANRVMDEVKLSVAFSALPPDLANRSNSFFAFLASLLSTLSTKDAVSVAIVYLVKKPVESHNQFGFPPL
jgi:hypothetical protein